MPETMTVDARDLLIEGEELADCCSKQNPHMDDWPPDGKTHWVVVTMKFTPAGQR